MFQHLFCKSERYGVGVSYHQKGPAVLRSGISKVRPDPKRRQLINPHQPSRHKLVDAYPNRPYTVQRYAKHHIQPQRSQAFEPLQEGDILSREDYFPGLIFRAPFYEESYDVNLDTKYLVQDTRFGSICRKVRKFIVVACYEESFVAVPLYTFNGNGLDRKVAEAKDQYVSVHDHRSSLEPDVYLYKDSTVCHITGVHSRWYRNRVIREGHLTRDSMERLRELPTAVERREISTSSPY